MQFSRLAIVVCAALAGWPGPLSADSVDIGALKDNTIYEDNWDYSNGAGKRFFAGRNGGGLIRRGLIAFDVAGSVPAGATVTGVTLRLYMSRTIAGPKIVALHRVTANWGEGTSQAPGNEGAGGPAAPGDATWIHRFYTSTLWTSQGGDFVTGASAGTLVGNEGFYTWSSPQLAADVQAWLDNPTQSFGWVLVGDESTLTTTKRFDGRTATNVDRRPRLTVVYTPGVTGACCFADGDCALLTEASCLGQGGTYEGPGSSCAPSPCPLPEGACCVSGVCVILTAGDCATQSGTYQGDASDCAPDPCVLPTGACCFPAGGCDVLNQLACLGAGGAYSGHGTTCTPNDCPQPQGACCFSGAECMLASAAGCLSAGGVYQGDGATCAPANPCPLNLEKFVDPLPIPAVAMPTRGVPGGAASYEIAVREFEQQLHRDLTATRVWGYAGTYPGPTIEAMRDAPIQVTWISDVRDEGGELRATHYLPVDECLHGPDKLGPTPRTVVHLHGGHVPAASDGYPEATILPGESVTYDYPNNQRAATLWYHDHALGITRLNVYMGLAGFYLLRDAIEDSLDLPAGEFEIAMAIQDRTFNLDGSLHYHAAWEDHFFGDTIVVNGKVWPYLEVKRGLYRFRILDGSNSRTYTLALSNGATFRQIGGDGGLFPAPVELSEVTISPGERADIVVDFSSYPAGTEIILTNSAPAPYPGTPGVGVIPQIMKLIVLPQMGWTTPLPSSLDTLEELHEADAVQSRSFVLRKDAASAPPCAAPWWLINDLPWHAITERPRLGDTEIWTFVNPSSQVHPMHMHLVMFQVLDRQAIEVQGQTITPVGKPFGPEPYEAGWKDTVAARPLEQVRVITRFESYTGHFPYHCHILEHEDHEMMRQFEIPCTGDTNGDHSVDVTDLVNVILDWGTDGSAHNADVDGDGLVDVQDLTAVILAWGPCP